MAAYVILHPSATTTLVPDGPRRGTRPPYFNQLAKMNALSRWRFKRLSGISTDKRPWSNALPATHGVLELWRYADLTGKLPPSKPDSFRLADIHDLIALEKSIAGHALPSRPALRSWSVSARLALWEKGKLHLISVGVADREQSYVGWHLSTLICPPLIGETVSFTQAWLSQQLTMRGIV